MLVDVSAKQAREFVSAWHYSKNATAGIARYGWEIDGALEGVTIYNVGGRDMQEGVFGKEYANQVMHHHRLALKDSTPKLTESEFIGAANRQLHRDYPDLMAVVTYADESYGHRGTIYQATNALYTGMTTKGNLYFLTASGEVRTTWSIKAPEGWTGTDWSGRRETARLLGWTEHRSAGKHRYVYLIGSAKRKRYLRDMLKWPVLPYPKEKNND